jgi:hypothetical protein
LFFYCWRQPDETSVSVGLLAQQQLLILYECGAAVCLTRCVYNPVQYNIIQGVSEAHVNVVCGTRVSYRREKTKLNNPSSSILALRKSHIFQIRTRRKCIIVQCAAVAHSVYRVIYVDWLTVTRIHTHITWYYVRCICVP